MTYEELVEKCKKLRGRHERAEAEYFVFLVEVETTMSDTWKGAGCATFDQFLRSNHLADSDRYRFFQIGLNQVGLSDALNNGVAWTTARGRINGASKDALEEFSARAKAFVEVENLAPAEQTVSEWAREAMAGTRA